MSISSNNMHAILWMMLTGFLAASINAIARYLSDDFHTFQLVFFYNLLGLLFFVPFILKAKISLKTNNIPLYCMRAGLEFVAFSLLFFALTKMPLPTVSALSFTSPLFGSIAAIIFLKEKSNIYRWMALIVGFVGVLIVARPGFADFNNEVALMVLASSMGFAFCGICIKKLTFTESNPKIAFYMLFLTSLIAAPFAWSVWQAPSMDNLALLILLGVLVAGVQFSVSQAFSKADITVILPVFFLNLIWASLYAYIIFNEIIDIWTVIGATVIIISTIYTAKNASKKALEEIVATEKAASGN